MANINDIASIAGVSNATVSRSFREPKKVSQKTRDKVFAAAKKIGFTPSHLGASLKQGRTFNIVVLVPDIANPYFSPLVKAMEKVASSRGYSVVLGDTFDSPQKEHIYGKMLLSKQADGIIINSERIPFEVGDVENLPPIVSTSELVDNELIHRVGVDNVAIGKLATSYLLSLGHKKIAVVAGTKSIKSSQDRLLGYQQALTEAGITFDEHMVFYTDYTTSSGAKAAEEIIKALPDATAIFSFGDLMSIGIQHTLNKLGYKMPEEMSLVSVDDISFASYCNPPLTTVAQPVQQLGEQSMHTLIDLIEQKKPKQRFSLLPHKLIYRDSAIELSPKN